MRLLIRSDGTRMGTKIINLDTGEEIRNVVAIKYENSVEKPFEGIGILTISVIAPLIEIEAPCDVIESVDIHSGNLGQLALLP